MKFITLFLLLFVGSLTGQSLSSKYSEAMEEYHKAEFVIAYERFLEFFAEYPYEDELSSTAKFYLAEVLYQAGKPDAAAAHYEYFVDRMKWSNFRDKALYNLGLIYFNNNEFNRSRLRLTSLLNDYPESDYIGSALYWIGESYIKENRLSDAVDFFQEAISNRRNNKFVDYSIYALAFTYEQMGDYENAVTYYDELLSYYKESPLVPSAQIRIGICYFRLNDFNFAILELNSPNILDLPYEQQAEAKYLLANSFYRTREFDQSEKIYLDIIQQYPSASIIPEARYGLAWSYFQQKKYNDSYRIFNSLSDGRDSLAIYSFYWKGESKRYAGQESEAFAIYEEFLKRFPNHPLAAGVHYQIGVLYFNNKRYDAAERLFLTATSSPDYSIRSGAFSLLGEINLEQQKFLSAKNYFETALSIPGIPESNEYRAIFGLGVSYFFLNQYQESIEHLSDVNFRAPNFESDKVNFYLAEAFFAKGEYGEALRAYSRVNLDNSEVGALALYGRAYAQYNLKDFGNAIQAFNDFIRRNPRHSRINDARLRLADSYYANRDFAAASRVYREAFNVRSGNLNDYALYQYAQALYRAGNISEAINEFTNLAQRFPNSAYADRSLYVVGWIYFQNGNFNEAISRYKNLLQLYPRTNLAPMMYYSIGDSYFNIGRYDSAIVNYNMVINEYPNSSAVFDAVNGLQYSYVAIGRPENAIALINDFVSKNPTVSFADQIYFKKGELNYSLRRYEQAKTSYKEFIANFPRSSLIPDAYFWVGKSAQMLNQNEEAIFNFRRVFDSYPNTETGVASVIEMGNIFNETKNYAEAIKIFDAAVEKLPRSPRIPEILFSKATTYVNMQDIVNAYETFDYVIQYYGTTLFADKAKFELGLIEFSAGRYEYADNHFRALAEKRVDDLGARAQYYYGVSLFEQNKINEAITALVRIRSVFASYDEWLARSYLKLGECYEKLNDKERAREMYRAVLSKHKGDSFGIEAQNKLRSVR